MLIPSVIEVTQAAELSELITSELVIADPPKDKVHTILSGNFIEEKKENKENKKNK